MGLVAPLKTPSQAQHFASSVGFLEVPCPCLSTSYTRCGLCGEVYCSSCSCSHPVTAISPQRCPSLSKGSYLSCSVQYLSVPKCVSGSGFSWAREASLTARIITLPPTCCTKYNIYSLCYIVSLMQTLPDELWPLLIMHDLLCGVSERDGS